MKLTLPLDSTVRKGIPMARGCLAYFPAALAGVAAHSEAGNEKHNKGQPLHWSRGKSADHADCVVRHLMDLNDMLAAVQRGDVEAPPIETILAEANALSWRALALTQELHELLGGAPVAPGAREPK